MLDRFFESHSARSGTIGGQGDYSLADAGEPRAPRSELNVAPRTLSYLEAKQKRAGAYVTFNDDASEVGLSAAQVRLHGLRTNLVHREHPMEQWQPSLADRALYAGFWLGSGALGAITWWAAYQVMCLALS